jgi:hypothetical protein
MNTEHYQEFIKILAEIVQVYEATVKETNNQEAE